MTLRPKSKSRVARAKRLTERYADSKGVPFDEYRFHLPDRVSEWPKVVRVDDDSVEQKMHGWYSKCWNCGAWRVFEWQDDMQTHHVVGGTRGRSDEYTNIAVLCARCHGNANTAALPMGHILYIKWKHDRQHTDWVRLALLHRQHLPDLITDKP